MKKIFSIVFQVLVLLIYLLSALLFCVVGWIHDNLNVTLEQILSTVTGRVEGFSLSQTVDIRTQIKPIVIVLLLVLLIVLLRVLEKKAGKNGAKKRRILFTAVIAALSAVLLIITGKRLDIVGMLESRSKVTTLYEEHYVVPDCSMIPADKDTNNLEVMEHFTLTCTEYAILYECIVQHPEVVMIIV